MDFLHIPSPPSLKAYNESVKKDEKGESTVIFKHHQAYITRGAGAA